MKTFVIRARKGSIRPERIAEQVGSEAHIEIIAHTLANAFYFSQAIREDVEVYVVLDGTPDFPRSLRFSAAEGLSLPGFHETGILETIADALRKGRGVTKNGSVDVAPGIQVLGYGFDVLMQKLMEERDVFLLDRHGEDIRSCELLEDAVFVLSDHMAMPKKSIKGMERKGLRKLSVGPRMLFASQCVTLIHNELDLKFG